jgi:hypothetical protein
MTTMTASISMSVKPSSRAMLVRIGSRHHSLE